jgi:hypothetical protein
MPVPWMLLVEQVLDWMVLSFQQVHCGNRIESRLLLYPIPFCHVLVLESTFQQNRCISFSKPCLDTSFQVIYSIFSLGIMINLRVQSHSLHVQHDPVHSILFWQDFLPGQSSLLQCWWMRVDPICRVNPTVEPNIFLPYWLPLSKLFIQFLVWYLFLLLWDIDNHTIQSNCIHHQ